MIQLIFQWVALFSVAIGSLFCSDADYIEESPILSALSRCANTGENIRVTGIVQAVTFDNEKQGNNYQLLEERYYLLTALDLENYDCDIGNVTDSSQWGIGVKLSPDFFGDDTPKLQNGTRIRVEGTYQYRIQHAIMVPIIDPVSRLEVFSSSTKRLSRGEPCDSDMECDDNLICGRSSSLCSTTPITVGWASTWHDMNGACETDSDCPLGQVCYLEYTIVDTGRYAVRNLIDQDRGKHICVLADDSGWETLCPNIGTAADLAGGRYVTGKEICIRGKVILKALNSVDGDTHLQLAVDAPLIYPKATDSYATWGATTEIDPQYKDPVLGIHTVNHPVIGENIIVLGTYRYDDPHGWFEIHPVKAWWPDERDGLGSLLLDSWISIVGIEDSLRDF